MREEGPLRPFRTHAIFFAAIACLAACKGPPQSRIEPDSAQKERGLALIKTTGCGACHEIPGVSWPKGKLGPSLAGFDDAGLIAGTLPNEPAILAAFVRNAPATKPGSTMPAMPLRPDEADAVAAYLYGLDHD